MMDEAKREQDLREFERWYKDFKGIPQGYPVNYGRVEARNMWITWQARASLLKKGE